MLFKSKNNGFEGGGIILFDNVEDALRAEKALKKENFETKLVAPPPALRKGCDLALEINLVELAGIERALRDRGAQFMEVHPLKGGGDLLEIVKVTDFGRCGHGEGRQYETHFRQGFRQRPEHLRRRLPGYPLPARKNGGQAAHGAPPAQGRRPHPVRPHAGPGVRGIAGDLEKRKSEVRQDSMLLICGTVPMDDLPLTAGEVSFNGEHIVVNDRKVPCTQGTAALISAACATAAEAGSRAPHALIVGDNGNGRGSRQIYEYVAGNLPRLDVDHLVLHYMLPVMGLMRKICAAADKCRRRPVLVADAAAMYAAKAAGLAPQFDVFTPDLSELAFLADPEASHPAYVGKHLFGCEICERPGAGPRCL